MMRAGEKAASSPQTIMQAFRQASDLVAESHNLDEMIGAYDKVINFCSGNVSCRLERSTKRDMLLYWAYSHIAKAYIQKSLPEAAYLYYQKALHLANDDKQKALVLEKMLDVAGTEGSRIADKCRKILQITNQLTDIYKKKADNSDLHRINVLAEKTLEVLKKSGS